ncbi:6-phosphofructo-2-kinase [Cordyceps javanica]|uniref:6-phosphofructo-2-kinase n=1 Tax=Cordyceps javanica TaxID=43265 RepID=A0A545VQP2_9HYPO|nr:6-phosphofructo-2-kinase [Cordyceps javanica]TQW04049.1 6-phosphofructo-2-kinase [Cordyceps javanica]
MDTLLTAEIAANAPRYRRKSSTFIDGIHDVTEDSNMAPAQLYSTMSGRLFHSGRIAIVMVGPPARGKTHVCVSLARYLGWLGVKTRIFHLGDYRRATIGPESAVPKDYFFPSASPESVILRQKILKKCREDIYGWLNHENGQVAIYDAVNPTASGRRSLAKELAKHDVQTLFIESFVDDERILRENARNVKISSPDFAGMDPDEAAKLYLKRIEVRIPVFETMAEEELNYIKMINAGEKFFYNNVNFSYLSHRIVFYLTNLHIKARKTFFVRAGTTTDEDSFRADAPLSEAGRTYAKKMTETILKHREQEHAESGETTASLPPLTVWTSTRLRTIQTADPLRDMNYKVRQRSQMSQLNPGICEKLSERVIRQLYPQEVEKHESYHDLAVRLEPIILELEREQNDLLIIAHESVLRVLYAYLMHCSTVEIPALRFPRDEIIEIIPAAYQNEARRIHIPGLDPEMIPGSPDGMKLLAAGSSVPPSGPASRPESLPASGQMTPLAGVVAAATAAATSAPVESATPLERPPERVINKSKDTVADKLDDED